MSGRSPQILRAIFQTKNALVWVLKQFVVILKLYVECAVFTLELELDPGPTIMPTDNSEAQNYSLALWFLLEFLCPQTILFFYFSPTP